MGWQVAEMAMKNRVRSAAGGLGVGLWGLIAVGTLIHYAGQHTTGTNVEALVGASPSDSVESSSSMKTVTGKVRVVDSGTLLLEVSRSPVLQGSAFATNYSFELRDTTIERKVGKNAPGPIARGDIVEVLYTESDGQLIARMIIDLDPAAKR
jgi:hypothetical protein